MKKINIENAKEEAFETLSLGLVKRYDFPEDVFEKEVIDFDFGWIFLPRKNIEYKENTLLKYEVVVVSFNGEVRVIPDFREKGDARVEWVNKPNKYYGRKSTEENGHP